MSSTCEEIALVETRPGARYLFTDPYRSTVDLCYAAHRQDYMQS